MKIPLVNSKNFFRKSLYSRSAMHIIEMLDFICCGVELGSSEQDPTMERKDSTSVILKKVSVC